MNGAGQPGHRDGGAIALCVVLSLLLHLALAWALDFLPRHAAQSPRGHRSRHVQLVRAKPKPADTESKPELSFAKTSPDEKSRPPEQADFIGKHDSRASGSEDTPQRRSDAPLPTMAGRESDREIVTFDQERQDGDVAWEGKRETSSTPEAGDSPPEPQPSSQADSMAYGSPDGHKEQSDVQGESKEAAQPAATATASLEPEPPAPGEGIALDTPHAENAREPASPMPPPAPLGREEGTETTPTPPAKHPRVRRRAVAYDPSLADNAQVPGLRTYERRTRSTGRFIIGRRPALNVASTPRGRYEAEIYRRIARMWYAACDEHRGDIIPGSLTVSLRLTKKGSIDSMGLMHRHGASISQQSFTFNSIRRASLPPMPSEVQKEVIGKLYEMIITFTFD